MTGAIWIIQIVHYPSFNFVAENQFQPFHHFHSRQITWIVAPTMGIELVSGLMLCYLLQGVWIFQFALILLIWLATFFISVPLHNKLGQKRDEQWIRKLIVTNWLRTLLWSLRTFLVLLTVSIRLA